MKKQTAELMAQAIPEPKPTPLDVPQGALDLIRVGNDLAMAANNLRAFSLSNNDIHKKYTELRKRAAAMYSEAAARLMEQK